MLSSLRFPALRARSAFPHAAPSPSTLPTLLSSLRLAPAAPISLPSATRFRGQLAPRRTKYRKSHKGRVSVPTGGSTKGTTLAFGEFGLRVKHGVRLTAKMIQSCQDAIRRKIKVVKGAQLHLRVFPDLPVCVKGNETRMGKGKGSFEYWAVRVPPNRIVFEIGGGGIRSEIAEEALRLAQVKFPVPTEFVVAGTPPKLGGVFVDPPRSNDGPAGGKAALEGGHVDVTVLGQGEAEKVKGAQQAEAKA